MTLTYGKGNWTRYNQWRSQYGANGPGTPKASYVIRTDPTRFLGGRGGVRGFGG